MDSEDVTGLERGVIEYVAPDRKLGSIGNYLFPVLDGVAREVSIGEQCIALVTTSHGDQLHGCHILRERIRAWPQDFAPDAYLRRIHLTPTEDTDGVERLQGNAVVANQRVRQVELNRLGMKIGGYEANDVALRRGLRQQVLVRMNDVGQLHAIPVGKFARPGYVAFYVDGALAIRQDRCHMDAVTILNGEGCNLGQSSLRRVCGSRLQAHRLALFVGINAIDGDVVERGGYGDSAGVIENFLQRFVSFELINCRSLDHAEDGHLRAGWRNKQRVASLQAFVIHTLAVKEKLIEVDFADQLLTTVVTHDAKRANAGGATRLVDGVEGRREGADVIRPGTLYAADHIYPH